MSEGSVLLFGRLKDAFGTDRIALPADAVSAASLRVRLAEAHPDLSDMIRAPSVRIAVNQELVMDEEGTPVGPADEIALLPPLSGG